MDEHLGKHVSTNNSVDKERIILPVVTWMIGIGLGFLIANKNAGEIDSRATPPTQAVSHTARRSFYQHSAGEAENVHGRPFNPTNTPDVQSHDSRQNALSNLVAEAASEDSAAYDQLFDKLGLDRSRAAMLKAELINLHHLAISAGEPLLELKQARQKFDKWVREILGDEGYSKYRLFEESKPARRELALLRKYAWEQHNTALDPVFEEALTDLIRVAGATTTESWHGPYDPAPRPMVGEEAIHRLRDQFSDLKARYSVLEEKLNASGVSSGLQRIVQDYYAHTIEGLEKNLAFWNRSISEIIAENEKMIDDKIKREFGTR